MPASISDIRLLLRVKQLPQCAHARRVFITGGTGYVGSSLIFQTDDCRGTYESLRAAGVEFTQEPTERFYGTDCALRDPSGNPLRFTQPPTGPIVVPSAEELER